MRILLGLAICLLVAPVQAQNAARVRAIEHPNFSRLVFEISPTTTWTSRQAGRETILTLNGVKQKFDAASLFDRMSRSRILNFSQRLQNQGLSVTLELGCDCEIIVDKLAVNQLALDVWRKGSRSLATGSDTSVLQPDPLETQGAPGFEAEEAALPPRSDPGHSEDAAQDLRLAGSIAAEARQLEEEIARIASEGFLDRNEQHVSDQGEVNKPDGDLTAGPTIPFQAPSHRSDIPFAEGNTQTRIGSTLIDTAPITPEATSSTVSVAECETYGFSVPANVSAGTMPFERLGQMRTALINIDGSLNEEAWRSLARYYISIGFGSEAIVTLNEIPDQRDTDIVLADIAKIVEGLRPAGSLLSHEDYCPTKLGIWRLASGKVPREYQPSEILIELANLPNTIRKAVGLMVSRHVELDNPELARDIHNLIERSPETDVPVSQEEIVQQLVDEAALKLSTNEDAGRQAPASKHENEAISETAPAQNSQTPTIRAKDVETELDLGIAAKQLSGTGPGLTATLTLAKYEAETGNLLEAVKLLNEALDEYGSGSLEIYQTGTELLLKSSKIPELRAQFVLAALAGRKFLLATEHQQVVEARIAELGLPNLTLFR